MVRRRELLAYLIAAGIAGTILVGPYVLRIIAGELFMPGHAVPVVPVVLLPIVWGAWNLLWARRHPPLSIGVWGAVLGLAAAAGINAYLLATRVWFGAAALLLVFLPVVYWLLWRLVVGPLNEALGVEGERGGRSRPS
jgi:hypothetical protein